MAMPVGTAMRAPGASSMSRSIAASRSRPAEPVRGIGGQGQVLRMRQSLDADFHAAPFELFGDARGQARAHFGLGHLRPVFDAGFADQMDAVAVAAHHVAGDVIGDDPVARPCARAWRRRSRPHRRSRRQSRSPGAAAARLGARVARMSGFSTSLISGTTRSVVFLILLLAAMSGRQSATAAAITAHRRAGRPRRPPASRAPW